MLDTRASTHGIFEEGAAAGDGLVKRNSGIWSELLRALMPVVTDPGVKFAWNYLEAEATSGEIASYGHLTQQPPISGQVTRLPPVWRWMWPPAVWLATALILLILLIESKARFSRPYGLKPGFTRGLHPGAGAAIAS